MAPLRLQHRIVVPFVIVGLAATAAAGSITWFVTSRALEGRVRSQLASGAAAVARGDLASNPAIVQMLQEIVGAAIITMDADGRVIASSSEGRRAEILAAAKRAVLEGGPGGPDAAVTSMDCGAPCLVAYRAVEGRPGITVALVAEASELTAATRSVARGILAAALLGVVLMVFVSQAVVRRVMAPLDALVRFVRDPSALDMSRRAEVAADETGAVAGALNEMLDRLAQAQRALVRSEKLALAGLMAARVAHDVRNPLSSIKMQTQLLHGRLDGDHEDRALLAAVLRDIGQVESVVQDLLALASPGVLNLRPNSIGEVIRQVLGQMGPQFAHRKITTAVNVARDLPALLLDPGRFKQALVNVVVNASDAMPTGGVLTIEVNVKDNEVTVTVADDGTGVDPAVADRVFDAFVTTKTDGVGLGLVNARAVVEGHGGRIRLEPRYPRGTCVFISLPVPAVAPAPGFEAGSVRG